ncbi:hypothetical protein [Ferruginibacter sp.]|nr:hypothetical protein [Ferruginibacter sp.]
MKHYLLLFLLLLLDCSTFAQTNKTNSFDVFTYQPPEFFTKSELPSSVQFALTNKDGSFCIITLYKSLPSTEAISKIVSSQWNEQVVKRLNKADKKPGKILTEQMWDGWSSTLAIGNFYQNKKKAVVMLNSFKKNNNTACAVFTLSDKRFKPVVDQFSKTLHLIP